MEESSTYQLIEELGGRKYLTRAILDLGRLKFGEPTATQLSALEGIRELDRLEEMNRRILTAMTWDELLA